MLKRHRGWRRELVVDVEQAGGKRRLRFPADQQELAIPDVADGAPCRIAVGPRNLLKRLVGKREVYDLPPANGGLRAVISGSGRCGTNSVARFLDGLEFRDGTTVRSRHETLAEYLLEPIGAGDAGAVARVLRGLPHHIEASPPLSLVPDALDDLAVVQLVRDGRRVVQSGMNRGWYQNDSPWNRVKPDLPGDAFERSCRFWVLTNTNLEPRAGLRVRLEDLSADDDARAEFLEFLGVAPSERTLPRTNTGTRDSRPDGWTDEQHETFARICGDLMDRYYPGWR